MLVGSTLIPCGPSRPKNDHPSNNDVRVLQVSLLIGTADAKGLKQDLDLTLGPLREALPAAE